MNVTDFPILLVEDEPDEIVRVQEALAQANLVNPLRIVNDGRKAIAYLSGQEEYADREAHPFPSLVLLDRTLPESSGFEVLAWIRSHPNLESLPVILLTPSTADPGDSDPSAAAGANSNLAKPVDRERLLNVLKSIDVFRAILDGTRPEDEEARLPLQSRHVLVIDRDADFLRSIGGPLLRRVPPIVVDPATNPPAALGRLARNFRDALVYERGVGESEDFGFLSKIRALKPDLPVIVLCAERDEAFEVRAIQKGVAGVLLKQARMDEFLDQLHGLLVAAKTPSVSHAPQSSESKPPRDSWDALPRQMHRKASGSGRRQDTEILGRQINFKMTSWDLVRAAPRREALDALIRIYWKPLYFFVRQRGFDNEEAKDIVQEFLVNALERRMIRRADPLRGRFRTFLLASLTNFLKDRRRSSGRLKRGGGHAPVSLEQFGVEPRYARPVNSGEPPETILDRAWAKGLLDQCLLELEGQPSHLRAFDLQMQGVDYVNIAKATGLSQTAAKTAVHRLRLRLRSIIRSHLSLENATEEEVGRKIAEFTSLLA